MPRRRCACARSSTGPIFEASSDAFVLRDAELDIVDVNPAFLQLYGFTREQLAVRGGYPENYPAGLCRRAARAPRAGAAWRGIAR